MRIWFWLDMPLGTDLPSSSRSAVWPPAMTWRFGTMVHRWRWPALSLAEVLTRFSAPPLSSVFLRVGLFDGNTQYANAVRAFRRFKSRRKRSSRRARRTAEDRGGKQSVRDQGSFAQQGPAHGARLVFHARSWRRACAWVPVAGWNAVFSLCRRAAAFGFFVAN